MALTNQTIGPGGITGGTHTIQLTDSAQRVRFYDLAFLAEGAGGASGFSTSRPGVLPGSVDTSGTIPTAMVCTATGTGLNISVRPGAGVVERSTLVGSYVVAAYQSGQVTLATADATNSRIDRVDLQVLDGALGDNSGTSLTRYVVTTGVASGSPAVPTAPINSIPLCQVLLPANTVTLTNGMFSDKRKSAGLRGAARFMLPGDALSDLGIHLGEQRQRILAGTTVYGTNVLMTDYWGADAAWHGLGASWELAEPSQTGSGTLGSGATATLASLVIPDPGVAYHIECAGQYEWTNSSGAAVATIAALGYTQVGSATADTNVIASSASGNWTTNTSTSVFTSVPNQSSKSLQPSGYTGSQTVYFVAKNGGGSTLTISTGDRFAFQIKIVPA